MSANPFTGAWIANIEKSRRHASHQFQSAKVQFDVAGDQVVLTQSGVNMSGKAESSTVTFYADGQEHPVSPQAPGVVAIARWLGSHTLETVGKRGEQELARATYEVSPNGLMMTAKIAGRDAQGAMFDQEIVFDRG